MSGPLLSIHVATKRPRSFEALVDRLEASATDVSSYEICVKVDHEDPETEDFVRALAASRKSTIKVVVAPRHGGYFDIWRSFSLLLGVTHPEAYFLWPISDEVHFTTPGWDDRLRRYVGLFPDHIFRLRVHQQLRNYHSLFEVCPFADFSITTKRWMDVSGNWADCHGTDAYQQAIAWYLGREGVFRDVPLLDVAVGGSEAGLELSRAEAVRRARWVPFVWDRLLSHPIREDCLRRALRLKAAIRAHERELAGFAIDEDAESKEVVLRTAEGEEVERLRWRLPRLSVWTENVWRILNRPPWDLLRGRPWPARVALHIGRALLLLAQTLADVVRWPVGLLAAALGFPGARPSGVPRIAVYAAWLALLPFPRAAARAKERLEGWEGRPRVGDGHLFHDFGADAAAPARLAPGVPLLSIHVASNRPRRFEALVDRMEATAADVSSYEICVKVDDEDPEMQRFVRDLAARRRSAIKVVVAPRHGGYYEIWRTFSRLLEVTHPDAYFLWPISDEVHFTTPGWDERLRRYVGLFPDHLFRLRIHQKLRNYYDVYEICPLADFPITTKRWCDVSGSWADCHGTDSFQQGIVWHLGLCGVFRDVPLLDIETGGLEAGREISDAEAQRRALPVNFMWDRLLSHSMRENYLRRARRIQAAILARQRGLDRFAITDDDRRKQVELRDEANARVVARLPWRLPWLRVSLENLWRIANRPNYDGFYGRTRAERSALRAVQTGLAVLNAPSILGQLALYPVGVGLAALRAAGLEGRAPRWLTRRVPAAFRRRDRPELPAFLVHAARLALRRFPRAYLRAKAFYWRIPVAEVEPMGVPQTPRPAGIARDRPKTLDAAATGPL